MFKVVLLVVSASLFAYAKFPVTKNRSECDLWASQGECINNAGYMWSNCHSSCVDLAKDTHEKCEEWANTEECTNNPNYINLHCPVSCQMAVAWNPWMRRSAGIRDQLPYNEDFAVEMKSCTNPVDLIGAASMIHQQLQAFVAGGGRMTAGLVSKAPSDYLGMLGLVEAIVYGLRLCDLNTKHTVDLLIGLPTLSVDSKSILEQAVKSHDKVLERFHNMIEVVSSGYSSDLLMRNIPGWVKLLETSIQQSDVLLDEYQRLLQHALPSSTLCPAAQGPGIVELTKLFPTLAKTSSSPISFTATLSNGIIMPLIGLGTWQLEGDVCETAVIDAIRIGYRHIDTAEAYRNEANVGWGVYHAINDGLVTRQDMFIATKLSDESNGGYDGTRALIARQLADLQLDYIDLYMLHSPMRDAKKQQDSWRALEELVGEGKIRSLGVSNFGVRELKSLLSHAKIKPTVIQNKVDVYHIGKQIDPVGEEIASYAKQHGIIMVAYSSISAYPFVMKPTEDPIIKFIASHHPTSSSSSSTAGQVILRWCLQHGMAVIPRSSNIDRLQENIDVLKMIPLDADEMHIIDALQYLVETPVTKAVAF